MSQMRSYGDSITDETVVAKVLTSLTPKFDDVVAAIEESKDLSIFSFDELMGSLQAHESPLFSVIEEEVEEDFVVEVEVEPIPYTAPFVTSMATPKSFVGPSLMKQIMQRRRKNKTLSCSWLRQKPRSLEVTFLYIDSGCSHHITGDKSKFSSLDESVRSHVRLGDDKQLQIEGQGTAKIYTGDHKRFIKDVHFAPCLAHNLLSVGQLMETGHSIFFNDDAPLILFAGDPLSVEEALQK
ncbi:hypothetical protein Tco_1349225, partial [Tanacetum coccineum]